MSITSLEKNNFLYRSVHTDIMGLVQSMQAILEDSKVGPKGLKLHCQGHFLVEMVVGLWTNRGSHDF